MPKAVISASVNLDIASKIADEARARGWSVSEIVNRALQAYVEHQAQQPRTSGRSGRVATVTPCDQTDKAA